MTGERTTIEALCYLLSKLQKADKIHLVKLMYLADKYHLMNYGRTITNDEFKAFENGPAGSRTMDVLDFDPFVLGKDIGLAKKLFQRGEGHEYLPGEKCLTHENEMLSESDIEALDFAVANFGKMNKWEVVDYTHTLQEWKQYESSFKKHLTKREPIKTEEVLLSPNDKYFHVQKEHIEQSLEILTGTFDQVDIPLKIQLPIQLKDINDFCIVRFQDKTLQNPDVHWYVLIPAGSSHFLIAMITSHGDKRAKYYRGTPQAKAISSLVKINNNDFGFLSRDSVVECNSTIYMDIQEIIHRIEEEKSFRIEKEQVPPYLKKEIVSAINNSPLVGPLIKKLAIAANPI